MREIRFRGFNRKNNEWLYGFYLQNRGAYFVCPDEFANGKSWEDYEIDKDTLGQFTGLHDKNGKEIYEGDIVEMMRKPERGSKSVMTRHIVIAHNVADWSFKSLTKEVLGLGLINQDSSCSSSRFEVVGNIHDNPDMVQEVSLNIPERKHKRISGKVKVEFLMDDTKVSTSVSKETAQTLIKQMTDIREETQPTLF